MVDIEILKNELKKLFDSLESDEVLLTIKEVFIERLIYNYEFNEVYTESKKNEYFNKLEEYLKFMQIGLYKQRKISILRLDELYNIYDYEEYDYISNVLNCSIEYIKSSYIEIDMLNRNITNHNIPNDILRDLEKINKFLSFENK